MLKETDQGACDKCGRDFSDNKYVYALYATTEQGEGMVMCLGYYRDPTEIEINTAIIKENTLVTIERIPFEEEMTLKCED